MVVFAHNGHWLASLMYMLPVVICLGFVLVAKIKDRGRPGSEPRTAADEPGGVSEPTAGGSDVRL